MPVMSYLAYPAHGHAERLEQDLALLPGVECTPSEQGEVLILVTDTPDEQAEQGLQDQLRAVEGLEALVLVSAFADDA
jgi:nitrate reductase NapAB chaperone NapD